MNPDAARRALIAACLLLASATLAAGALAGTAAAPRPEDLTPWIYVPVVHSNPPTPTPGPCPCDQGDLLNCSDFDTRAQAQTCFDHCWALGYGDVHRLDFDDDGQPCESLP